MTLLMTTMMMMVVAVVAVVAVVMLKRVPPLGMLTMLMPYLLMLTLFMLVDADRSCW